MALQHVTREMGPTRFLLGGIDADTLLFPPPLPPFPGYLRLSPPLRLAATPVARQAARVGGSAATASPRTTPWLDAHRRPSDNRTFVCVETPLPENAHTALVCNAPVCAPRVARVSPVVRARTCTTFVPLLDRLGSQSLAAHDAFDEAFA